MVCVVLGGVAQLFTGEGVKKKTRRKLHRYLLCVRRWLLANTDAENCLPVRVENLVLEVLENLNDAELARVYTMSSDDVDEALRGLDE